MGHDASQPATSAVLATQPRAEFRQKLQLLPVDVLL